mgnify:CR=1 FL=1
MRSCGFPYHDGDTKIDLPGGKLADLPAGTINHHWTKDLAAGPDGSKLYATVGSNSNVGENGIAAETQRAAVLEIDRTSGSTPGVAAGRPHPDRARARPGAPTTLAPSEQRGGRLRVSPRTPTRSAAG